ncbi:hypothetical protein ES319_D05G203400v1 [Gossypium barbadense]|uniref:Uncharacterized protein n=2 Tax=Gossypium TaxID=3633 RepID=A0A5J5RGM2_GOSBA|nr:hypothetical protein ES319_D05G203400v1 [Gossypium barbadense]TYG69219.1 hypothetical protein ES288_D05G214000v1 [Gossypium darwinii]
MRCPVKNQKGQGQCPIVHMVASGRPFNSEDYMALTPSWAIYGAEESRYYPNQSWYRKKVTSKVKKLSNSELYQYRAA